MHILRYRRIDHIGTEIAPFGPVAAAGLCMTFQKARGVIGTRRKPGQ